MDATRLSTVVSTAGLAGPHLLAPAPLAPASTKALLFELTDVLYESTVWRRWLLRLLARMGLHTNYQSFFENWDRQFLSEINSGRRTMREALAAFLLENGLAPTLVEEIVSAAGAQHKAIEAEPRLLPGVAATLAQLAASGLPLAVSADTDQTADQVRAKLQKLGVAGQFRQVISSRDLRSAKPEPVCYLAAVTALGLTPHTVVFVGCRPTHLAGASAVGLTTVSVGGAADADHRLARFDQLLQLFG